MRSLVASGQTTPAAFRAELAAVPAPDRDSWLDSVLELSELPDDGDALPRGCTPYLPCGVDTLLAAVDCAEVGPSDVVVDVGAGLGRAAVAIHLLSGAAVIGVEIQPHLARAARELGERVSAARLSVVEGDAARVTGFLAAGSVFFLYCPFSGERLASVLADLERIARTRQIRVCCVDLPLPNVGWLTALASPAAELSVYRSTAPPSRRARC
jgi:SAM-dependent methyltransferase